VDESPHTGVAAAAEAAVVVRPRWWALPVAAAGCLVFVALCVVLLAVGGAANVAIGLAGIAFFGGGLVVLVLRRPWRCSLLVDERGVTWRRPGGDTQVRWADISAIRVTSMRTGRVGRTTFVTLTLHDPSAVDRPALGPLNRPLQAWNRRLVGGEASIGWSERDRSADELAALLNRRLDAWRAGAGRDAT
jgi:hypothetical protein